ncbi:MULTISPECIES: hypothetical protein [Mediterraneibacter]|jgi:hypothetical protein|uniref:hypothetical protein n=1 Tax=Mediterraneibacter TaxID=2316020 RepID=UPI001A9A3DDB|nr:hypothetical protein [[Ruminococcus] torques]
MIMEEYCFAAVQLRSSVLLLSRSEISVLPSCSSIFTIIVPCVEEESKFCAIPEEPDAANMPPVIWALPL